MLLETYHPTLRKVHIRLAVAVFKFSFNYILNPNDLTSLLVPLDESGPVISAEAAISHPALFGYNPSPIVTQDCRRTTVAVRLSI